MTTTITAAHESWPIAGTFTIARGAKTSAEVVVVTASDGPASGRGECLPYPRYGENVADTLDAIRSYARLTDEPTRAGLLKALRPGAARNALDCALWDLEAKRAVRPVWELAGLPEPRPVHTAFTLSIAAPDEMAEMARAHRGWPLLKLKLGGRDADRDVERLRAVHEAAPKARLIVDANEGWSFEFLTAIAPAAAECGVVLLEQPLPAHADSVLARYQSPVPLGADESMGHDPDLPTLATRYQVVNIKLDKTGGLTHALALTAEARTLGLQIMVGCMVATSLAMAPALLLAQTADFVDLDGPLLLARDRQPGLHYTGSRVTYPEQNFWGLRR